MVLDVVYLVLAQERQFPERLLVVHTKSLRSVRKTQFKPAYDGLIIMKFKINHTILKYPSLLNIV